MDRFQNPDSGRKLYGPTQVTPGPGKDQITFHAGTKHAKTVPYPSPARLAEMRRRALRRYQATLPQSHNSYPGARNI